MTTALRHAASRAAHEPSFLAYDLNIYAERNNRTREDLATSLGTVNDCFDKLALCRSPHRDQRFREDIGVVASYAEIDDQALGQLVRQADALSALASAPSSQVAPMLAAARQTHIHPVRPETKGKGMQPAWLKEAVDFIWGDRNAGDFPRDVELAVLWHLPIAIVEMQDLSGVSVSTWLRARGVDLPVHTPPHDLRGALVAFAGSGVLFLDARDDVRERRVTVAHEAGHFAVDYWLPRMKLAERAPHLLEVADGLRKPDSDDHVDALLARIPFGVHTHLFERDESGAIRDRGIEDAEERATQIAWELLAPHADISKQISPEDEFGTVRALETTFGLPRTTAREYAAHLRRAYAQHLKGGRFDWS
jgi:hypothetical protein